MADATIETVRTVYLYSSSRLIISYALAVFASLAALVLGSYSVYRNKGSYDGSVLTFASAMQGSEVS
jgi:hypothetical protein